ncbi:MAG: SRPBCC family protein [Bacteroidota bacterium]
MSRIIDAPVERVWKAWTDPDCIRRWWGPKYYTSPFCKLDLREGGQLILCMRAPEEQGGRHQYTAGVFKKIVPGERLEFTQAMSDPHGNPVHPSLAGLPSDFPSEVSTEVAFKPLRGDMTELTVVERGWTLSPMMVYSIAGLNQAIDKLVETLK